MFLKVTVIKYCNIIFYLTTTIRKNIARNITLIKFNRKSTNFNIKN